jgi:hypothetical protein
MYRVFDGTLFTEYILDLIVNSCDHLAIWLRVSRSLYLLTNQKNGTISGMELLVLENHRTMLSTRESVLSRVRSPF